MKVPNPRSSAGALACLLLLLTAFFTTAPAAPPARAVSPGETNLGMSYGDWSAAYWQWAYSIPFEENPLLDLSGAQCAVGQSRSGEPTPVFFLASVHENALPGSPAFNQVTRNCTVPAESYLLVPLISFACVDTPDEPDLIPPDEAELRACVSWAGNQIAVDSLHLRVDGKPVQGARRLGKFRAQSPAFGFTLPEDSLLVYSGRFTGLSDGYWVMLEPLPPGVHTVHFGGSLIFDDGLSFGQDVTYTLTVE